MLCYIYLLYWNAWWYILNDLEVFHFDQTFILSKLHNTMSQIVTKYHESTQACYGCSQQITFCAPHVHISSLFNTFSHVHIHKYALVIKINSRMNVYISGLHITTKSEILIIKSTLTYTSSIANLNI